MVPVPDPDPEGPAQVVSDLLTGLDAPMNPMNAELVYRVGERLWVHPAALGFADKALVFHWLPSAGEVEDGVLDTFHAAVAGHFMASFVDWVGNPKAGRRWQEGGTGLRVYREADGVEVSFIAKATGKRHGVKLDGDETADLTAIVQAYADGELA